MFSCSSDKKLKNTDSPDYQNYIKSGFIKTEDHSLNHLTIQHHIFKNKEEAMSYAMERRLLLLRKFESLIEPYFGTANAKSCVTNLRSSILNRSDLSLSAVLVVPSLGEKRVIHDCLTEKNTDWAYIQFLTCDKNFYDIRFYSPISKEINYQQFFSCGFIK